MAMEFPELKDIRRNFMSHSQDARFLLSDEENKQVDFDVFLPTYGRNLQRPYVWDSFQQQEYIWSLLYGRYVPPILMVSFSWNINMENKDRLECFPRYKIIDGKQRLMTHRNFMLDKFPLIVEGVSFLFSELPNDYKSLICYYKYTSNTLQKKYLKDISDDELLELFKWANFAGTPQEKNYLNQFVKICK